MKKLHILSIVGLTVSVALLASWWIAEEKIIVSLAKWHDTELEKFLEEAMYPVTIYEGLPNRTWEKELYMSELKRDDLKTIYEFTVYEDPLLLLLDEEMVLRQEFSDERNYEQYGGQKDCGGFHPDYAVEVKSGKSLLLSFSCGSVKLVSGSEVYDYEISEEGRYVFDLLLSHREKNRPWSDKFGRYALSKP